MDWQDERALDPNADGRIPEAARTLRRGGGRGAEGRVCAAEVVHARRPSGKARSGAKFLGDYQERSPLPLLFAVGPADGFTEEARQAAALVLSLGKMTLAHELARIVLLEQLYRAFTILKGHPYHVGH
jgi:rRNA large subunit m3Psi methyltransferase RlmH